MKAVIIAGGKGTRMGEVSARVPKSLLRVAGRPLLKYQLDCLKRQGFGEVFILTNYLSAAIEQYCRGYRGVRIECVREDAPLGTAGAIKALEGRLNGDFFVLYGDILINLDLRRLQKFHRRKKKLQPGLAGTLVVHPSNHPFDSDLIKVDEDERIRKILPKPRPRNFWCRNLASAGVYILSPEIFRFIPAGKKCDFGRDIFPKVLRRGGRLAAYATPEYMKDIGTPQRLRQVNKDAYSGRFYGGNLRIKKPAIFLDRDGVINREVGDLRRIGDFALLPGASAAIKKINRGGYYAIVITNQPAVAKGFCTMDDVLAIHNKMETLLGRQGAFLDAIYFCPHHPDTGFAGENKKYKIACACRKPNTGMIRRAAKDFNIDLKKSFLVGDSTRDAKTAENAKIKFIGVSTGYNMKDGRFKLAGEPLMAKNLPAAVNLAL